MNNMTALVSCFARAYHFRMNDVRIFSDPAASLILGEDYDRIAHHMVQGRDFFLPGFSGSSEEALRLIVDRQVSPSVLGRSAFCEQMLEQAVQNGCVQYLILGAGYDTFGIRNHNPDLRAFEADRPDILTDKAERIRKAGLVSDSVFVPCDLSDPAWIQTVSEHGFDITQKTFVSMLGISYYLTDEEFSSLLNTLGTLPAEVSLCFDVPTEEEAREAGINRKLAQGAGEEMKTRYPVTVLKDVLNRSGFYIRRLLDAREMTETYFDARNSVSQNQPMEAPQGVSYVLAEKGKGQV